MNIVLAVVKNVVSQGGARDLGKVLELWDADLFLQTFGLIILETMATSRPPCHEICKIAGGQQKSEKSAKSHWVSLDPFPVPAVTEAFIYASAELRSDRDFVLEMLAVNPGSMQGASAAARIQPIPTNSNKFQQIPTNSNKITGLQQDSTSL